MVHHVCKTYGKVVFRELGADRFYTPVLVEASILDFTQTAYQQGLSCIDATFATQEALLVLVRDCGKPLLGLYDIEKAFNSIGVPILLERIYSVSMNEK